MDSDESAYFKANFIAKEARSSISDFCINVCKAKCCQRGKLVLFSKEEVLAVSGKNTGKFLKEKVLEKNEKTGNYFYDLERKGCKNLSENNLCLIHKSKNKPRICDDYPIFLTKKYVIVAKDCEASQKNLFENYLREIEDLGFKRI